VWRFGLTFIVVVCLSACGSNSAGSPTPPSVAGGGHSGSPTPTAAVSLSKPYRSFVTGLCTALSNKDAGKVIKDLPNYQYNSGVRYGFFGDGEGHSGDPSVLNTWLAADRIMCRYVSADSAGHGLLLTSGWTKPGGPWNLIEVDIFSGQWKINDFTFANQATLWRAMHLSRSIIPYRG
jgi:hypothetical protein